MVSCAWHIRCHKRQSLCYYFPVTKQLFTISFSLYYANTISLPIGQNYEMFYVTSFIIIIIIIIIIMGEE